MTETKTIREAKCNACSGHGYFLGERTNKKLTCERCMGSGNLYAIACKPQEGMVMVPVDDLRAVLLLDQTKDAEQRMDARNRLVKAAKDQS